MTWPFEPPLTPMEARVSEQLPRPPGWAYEPKWDGFRILAWSASGEGEVRLDSRNGRPLLRYFPELEPALRALPPGTVVDGEVVVVLGDVTSFDALQNRIHPAASRIQRLAGETPAQLVAFDLLALRGADLRGEPFEQRRGQLETLVPPLGLPWSLTPSTRDIEVARRWFGEFESAGCDGIVAKRLDGPYREGERDMTKVKHRRTADVVVGGYRVHQHGGAIGSLLLGMYDDAGQLHFIGHCSGFPDEQRVELLGRFEALRSGDSFGEMARRPGAQSRWSSDRDTEWTPVRPEVVLEVSYDQVTGGRFRHATRFERWRSDKNPEQCTIDQLERPPGLGFSDVVAGG